VKYAAPLNQLKRKAVSFTEFVRSQSHVVPSETETHSLYVHKGCFYIVYLSLTREFGETARRNERSCCFLVLCVRQISSGLLINLTAENQVITAPVCINIVI
jgi:hypothetical protein